MEKNNPTFDEISTSASNALFGKVTPNMRFITCGLIDSKIIIQVVFENEPNEEEVELISLFETYLLTGLYQDMDFDRQIIIAPVGRDFLFLPISVYGRFEGMEFA